MFVSTLSWALHLEFWGQAATSASIFLFLTIWFMMVLQDLVYLKQGHIP